MTTERTPLGTLLHQKRTEAGLSIVDVCAAIRDLSKQGTCISISSSYYCQVEGNLKKIDKISFDFFWAVGIVLSINPLELYLLSRPKIDRKYLKPTERDKLFSRGAHRKKKIRHSVILPGKTQRYLTSRGEWTTSRSRAKLFSYKGSARAALKRQQRQGWTDAYMESFET